MAVSDAAFRDVMSHWATGVTVVTTCHDGELHGMTVNSFSSLTVEPPLVLFCADRSAHTYGLVEASGVFAVNVLSAGQEELSNLFAGRYPERDADRFAGVAYRQAATGAPILRGSLGYLDCRVVARYPHGTHTIFVGAVAAAELLDAETAPLLYYHRRYRQFRDQR